MMILEKIKRPVLIAAIGLALTAIAVSSLADIAQPSSTQSITIEAIARPENDLQLAFTVDGKVSQLLVKQGMSVHSGQVLAELEDGPGKAQVALYQLKAKNRADIQAATAKLKLAKLTVTKLKYLIDHDAGSTFEYKKAHIQEKVARINLAQAKEKHQEAQKQLAVAQAQAAQYILKAPIDGVIDSVKIEKGESVKALDAVIRLVNTQTLQIDVPLPTGKTLALHVGDSVVVHSELPEQTRPMSGQIINIAAVADAASNTRMVRVSVSNILNWPAGIRVKVRFSDSSSIGPG